MSRSLSSPASIDGGRANRAAPFLVFAAGQSVSAIGTWAQKTAIGWLAWNLTHSVAWVGAIALADLIAALWVAPLSGVIVDWHNPYRVLQLTQGLQLLLAILLWGSALSGLLTIEGLLLFAIVEATLLGFTQPVVMTVTGQFGSRERVAQSIAITSIGFNIARSIGPAFAGLIMAHSATGYVFALNAASYLAAMFTVAHLRGHIHRPPEGGRGPMLADVADGFRYVARAPEVAMIFALLVVFSLLMRPFGELLPAFAGDVFAGGPQTLSTLMSALGAGALLGALLILRRHQAQSLLGMTLIGLLALPVALVLFCASSSVSGAVPFLVVAGAAHVICNIGLQSLLQLRADPAYRGRALAIFGLLFRAGPALGAFLAGLAAHWLGIEWIIGGVAVATAVFVVALYPAARRGSPPAGAQTVEASEPLS